MLGICEPEIFLSQIKEEKSCFLPQFFVVVRFFYSNYLQSIVYSVYTFYVRVLEKAFLYYSHLELF